MDNIILRKLDKENWAKCIEIEPKEEQKKFIGSPVVFYIAQSKFEKWMKSLAIYNENTLVGYLQYGINPELETYWIIAILIDKKYQGNNFGKFAIIKLLNRIKRTGYREMVFVGHKPDNIAMEHVLNSIGFIKTDIIMEGHLIHKINLSDFFKEQKNIN